MEHQYRHQKALFCTAKGASDYSNKKKVILRNTLNIGNQKWLITEKKYL